MAQGFSRDTVRVPLYRYFLTGLKAYGFARREFRDAVSEFAASSVATAGASSVAENDLHSTQIPTLEPGEHLTVVAGGTYVNDASVLVLRMKVGTVTVMTDNQAPVNFPLSGVWMMVAELDCHVGGTTGTIYSVGYADVLGTAAGTSFDHHIERVTGNVGVSPIVKVTQQFNNSDADNVVNHEVFSVVRMRSK